MLYRVIGHEAYPHAERNASSGDTMTKSESVIPGTAGDETVCPVCDSTNTEEIVGDKLDYRCLRCSAEFDPTGGRVSVE